jgi:hypothetical protein
MQVYKYTHIHIPIQIYAHTHTCIPLYLCTNASAGTGFGATASKVISGAVYPIGRVFYGHYDTTNNVWSAPPVECAVVSWSDTQLSCNTQLNTFSNGTNAEVVRTYRQAGRPARPADRRTYTHLLSYLHYPIRAGLGLVFVLELFGNYVNDARISSFVKVVGTDTYSYPLAPQITSITVRTCNLMSCHLLS